jgi:hypothetical protein
MARSDTSPDDIADRIRAQRVRKRRGDDDSAE